MIYTTYFAKIPKLPEDACVIAISVSVPKFYSGLRYRKLAPSWDIVQKFKNDGDWSSYEISYNSYLTTLSPTEVENDLYELSGGDDIYLVCYEKQPPCHRFLVGKWFNDNDIECEEFE